MDLQLITCVTQFKARLVPISTNVWLLMSNLAMHVHPFQHVVRMLYSTLVL